VEVGHDLARHLRHEERCDVVIALTHMRAPNDEHLARSVAEIDVVLGGHDHDYVSVCEGVLCVGVGAVAVVVA
jgi:2',3'-cyclic-nucleotide 2'-phosphodiesterase (5'-nucleotidase family)